MALPKRLRELSPTTAPLSIENGQVSTWGAPSRDRAQQLAGEYKLGIRATRLEKIEFLSKLERARFRHDLVERWGANPAN